MYICALSGSLVLWSVLIFAVFVTIGFFGDKYLKKQEQIKKAAEEDEISTSNEQSSNTNFDGYQENLTSVQNAYNEKNMNNNQNVRLQDVIGTDVQNNMSFNQMNNDPMMNNAPTNNMMTNNDVTPVANLFDSGTPQVNNNMMNNAFDNMVQNPTINNSFDNSNMYGQANQMQNSQNVYPNNQMNNNLFPNNQINNNDPMVSRPVPFDGNMQNDDNINNMF